MTGSPSDFPKGRWGQRVGSGGQPLTVKSHYDSDSVIPFPPTPPDSKESSSLEGQRRGPSGSSAKQVLGLVVYTGNTNRVGQLSTVDLLIKVACFVKKETKIANVIRS
jgi:hypothetical protein